MPVPDVGLGEVLMRLHAFGLNRSELHFRCGQASFGTFPRIPGIEELYPLDWLPTVRA